jgi:hypothetical protein
MRQGLGEARAVIAGARRLVLENPLTTGRDEGIALQIEVLILGRDASVTDEHVPNPAGVENVSNRKSHIDLQHIYRTPRTALFRDFTRVPDGMCGYDRLCDTLR